jgi:hypothetical protein
MRRIGTVVGLLAVLTAGGAHAAGELVGGEEFETQMLGQPNGAVTGPAVSPWSSDNSIFRAQGGGQSYEVLVDGVQVGTFSTSAGQDFGPANAPFGVAPPQPHGAAVSAGKPPAASPLFKPAAWSLVILGFAAIGLTLRGGRRRPEAASV